MALTLAAFQSTLNRPNDPYDPNGIAHSTDPADTGDGTTTKASRAATKIAYSQWLQDYRNAIIEDSTVPVAFPDNGEIDYADD
jgi:hypothetical protein